MYSEIAGVIRSLAGDTLKKVRKHTQNLIIDCISFSTMILLILTGIILHFVLPAKSKGQTYIGFTRHEWGEFHFWIAVIFTILLTIHLLLHSSWIKASFAFKKGR